MTHALAWDVLLASFSRAFTAPSFELFLKVAAAWAICPGKRTLTRVYLLAEPMQEKAHDAYHRFFREGAWRMDDLWRPLARLLVARFFPNGPIPLDVDDTLFHKSGRKVKGAGWWRDAVASTGQKQTVKALGLNLIVLTLNVKLPWKNEPLGLPVLMRLHKKGGSGLIELAEEMLQTFAGWFPNRRIDFCGDGFFASLAGHDLPRIEVVSRMRRDAALYEPPPPRKKQKGRPRKKGRRLPTPEKLALRKKGWTEVVVSERGKEKRRLVLVLDVLWYAVLPDRLVKLVVSRDPEGVERDDFFFTTKLDALPEAVVGRYSGRWAIEDTFKNVKQLLGGQDPQLHKGDGPERAASFSFWLYSVIWLWYIQTFGSKITWNPLPWHTKKSAPSFMDALAALRRVLWRRNVFSNSEPDSLPTKIIGSLIEVLALTA